ncbi:phospholipase A2 inhibitor and Ly6/PLAUR domain-containing protein-like, partial [Terrapene carolina triunguis]|uniref:phospholipase A2 inhibitor and Ly6/PLAUR domain-containing protein-like n=1 Tax=Terrapene triunguis TaxID=2587831 RepID=UPI000E77DBF4
GEKTQSIIMGCATSSQCKDTPFPMNFGMGKTRRSSFTCCQGDACTPSPISVPPAKTEPNGRRCRGCYSLSSEHCREETINCTGVETHCVEIAGTLTSGGTARKTVMKGCATESVCTQIEAGSVTFAGFSGDLTTAKCTAATSAASTALGPAGLLPPTLTGLLLLTLLS